MQNLNKQKQEQEREEKLKLAKEYMEAKRQSIYKYLTTPVKDKKMLAKEYDSYINGFTDEQREQIENIMYGKRVYDYLEDEEVINYSIVKEIVQLEKFQKVQFSKNAFSSIYKKLYEGFLIDPAMFWLWFDDILHEVYIKRVKASEQILKIESLKEISYEER